MAKVVHFEIPFDNKQRAMKFYADSFGWRLMDMADMNYVMAYSVDVDEQNKRGRSTVGCSRAPRKRRIRCSMSTCHRSRMPSAR
jgi:predicted enzyme related to lactoylglutathione lyase